MSNPVFMYEFRHSADGEHATTKDKIISTLNKIAKKWKFQRELSTTGYDHFQGTFTLIKKNRKHTLLDLLKNHDLVPFQHLEPVSNNGVKMAWNYVMKADSRTDGPWTDQENSVKYIPRQYRDITLWEWQNLIEKMHNEFNTRIINFVHDRNGCNGKSTIAALMALLHGALVLPPINDAQQLLQSVCDILSSRECRTPGTIFVDLPRCASKEKMNGIFAAIETLKNGFSYDVRNHYREWWFDSPQIWVFSNDECPVNNMSADRWVLWEFDHTERTPKLVQKKLEKYVPGFVPPPEPQPRGPMDDFISA